MLRPPSDLAKLLKALSRGRNSPLLKGVSTNYSMSLAGLREVESYLTADTRRPAAVEDYLNSALPYLEKLISKVGEDNKRRFLAEAVACLGVGAKRATVVMTWLVTLDHMYDYILAKKLIDFNNALGKRSDRIGKMKIQSKDDFADLKESVFMEVCRSAKIISNDVRKILDEKLDIRNTCAHPSTVEIHDSKVVNVVEDLVENVIARFTR